MWLQEFKYTSENFRIANFSAELLAFKIATQKVAEWFRENEK